MRVWRLAKGLGFRFTFCYIVLFSILTLFWVEWFWRLSTTALTPIVLWVGENLFGIDYPIRLELGGLDRTYDYLLLFCRLVLALAAAGAWLLLDRGATIDGRLREGLRVCARLTLGTVLLYYGVAKIFPIGQFPPLEPGHLIRTYGESSPMGLLWTFMGYSLPYRTFAGFMEVIPAVLLFFRRTASLGALLVVGVMGNVVVLNLCYDVPVKQFAIHLWLLSLFVAAPSLPRLVSVLVLHRSVPAPEPAPLFFSSHRARRTATGLYVILSGALALQAIYPRWKHYMTEASLSAEANAVRNIFDVTEMVVDGQVLPPSPGDATRWSRVWIRQWSVRVYWMNGRTELYQSGPDIDGAMTLDLRLLTDPEGTRRALLELRRDGRDGLVLEGEFEEKKVRVRLAKVDVEKSLLLTRGFRWISEAPFNR